MAPLTPDEIHRCKIGLYRWFVRNGHTDKLVPGFRAYRRMASGAITAVKTCGPQCRQQLQVFLSLTSIKSDATFSDPVRTALAPYMPVTAGRPPVGQLLRYDVQAHGSAAKDLIVLHETISPDAAGMADIVSVANYLAHTEYGIHAIVDAEGLAAAVDPDMEDAIFWHAASGSGNVNTRGIGIEQVSYTGDAPYWQARKVQLEATAKWCAYFCKQHAIPPVYDPACRTGICGHWDVTRTYLGGQGHYDCRMPPYPTGDVAKRAAAILKAAA